MDTKSIQYYITIYETRSLHRAADQLFISQQGLSRVLASLEKEYETSFFRRTAKGLVPTKAGECFYRELIELQKHLMQMRQHIHEATVGRSEIKVACAFGSMHLLYERFQEFYRLHPEIWIHWVEYTDHVTERVIVNDEADLGLVIRGDNIASLEMHTLCSREPVVLVYEGHPFYERESLKLADLKNEKIIMVGKQFHIYHNFKKACAQEGFYPDIAAETTEIGLCNTLVHMHEGIALIVDFVGDMNARPDVRAIPLETELLRWEVAIARSRGEKLSAQAQKFWDFLAGD